MRIYHRFCLRFRDVEDLLAKRGIIVFYETIRRGVRSDNVSVEMSLLEQCWPFPSHGSQACQTHSAALQHYPVLRAC
jgi:hypothetical protein